MSLVRKTRAIRSAGVQYQRTEGASQLTGDMLGVAPLGRFDQYHDATVTAVSLESRSRDLDLRRVSSSVSDVLARDIGVRVNLEHAPANDSNFAMRKFDHRDVSRFLRFFESSWDRLAAW